VPLCVTRFVMINKQMWKLLISIVRMRFVGHYLKSNDGDLSWSVQPFTCICS